MTKQEVQMSPTGELNFKLPQQEWTESDTIKSALCADQHLDGCYCAAPDHTQRQAMLFTTTPTTSR